MENNILRLQEALAIAIADTDFMSNTNKVNRAVEALTPKDELTRIFKQLQGNALKDFLVKKDRNIPGYTDENKTSKIKEYFTAKFQSHLANPLIADRAKEMYNSLYPAPAEEITEEA